MAKTTWRGSRMPGNAIGRGFTLMEVMIVIVIILLIVGLVSVNLFAQRDKAKEDLAKIDLNSLKQAIRLFNLEFERYPTSDEGLAVLWDKERLDPDAAESKWRSFVDAPKERDPWGSEWGYSDESETEGRPFDLWSFGPDKEDGTDDDISVWGDSESGDDAGASSTSGG